MVTLTLRHSRASLTDCLDRLYRSFLQLRRRPWWRRVVPGGLAVVEVQRSEAGLWHPHLHVITTARWVDQRELSREWVAVTGDSFVVDCRRVARVSVSYVAKYLAKVAPERVIGVPDALDEMVVALRGRRQVITFGDVHGIERDDTGPTPLDSLLDDWVPIGRLDHWITLARHGDAHAAAVLRRLRPSMETEHARPSDPSSVPRRRRRDDPPRTPSQ